MDRFDQGDVVYQAQRRAFLPDELVCWSQTFRPTPTPEGVDEGARRLLWGRVLRHVAASVRPVLGGRPTGTPVPGVVVREMWTESHEAGRELDVTRLMRPQGLLGRQVWYQEADVGEWRSAVVLGADDDTVTLLEAETIPRGRVPAPWVGWWVRS